MQYSVIIISSDHIIIYYMSYVICHCLNIVLLFLFNKGFCIISKTLPFINRPPHSGTRSGQKCDVRRPSWCPHPSEPCQSPRSDVRLDLSCSADTTRWPQTRRSEQPCGPLSLWAGCMTGGPLSLWAGCEFGCPLSLWAGCLSSTGCTARCPWAGVDRQESSGTRRAPGPWRQSDLHLHGNFCTCLVFCC